MGAQSEVATIGEDERVPCNGFDPQKELFHLNSLLLDNSQLRQFLVGLTFTLPNTEPRNKKHSGAYKSLASSLINLDY